MDASEMTAAEAELLRLARKGVGDPAARGRARSALEALWPQDDAQASTTVRDVVIPAVGAALTVKLPALLGMDLSANTYMLNIGLWVLAWVVVLVARGDGWSRRSWTVAGAVFLALSVFVNLFPFDDNGSTLMLTSAHLPFAVWFGVGAVRARGSWRDDAGRLDFIRFSGELLFYFALLALGGGVLMAISYQMFAGMSSVIQTAIGGWLLPCGAAGAVVVAAWLADNGERVMSRVALVVQRVFTPLFALVMAVFTVTAIPGGFFSSFRREELSVYDGLLVVVTALALYGVASQADRAVHRVHDWALLAMTTTGVTVDLLIVVAMVDRTLGSGLSPNRVAATGLNLVLLANLTALTLRQWQRVRGTDPTAPAQWSARYIPVLAGWSAFVAIGLPVLFWGS